jgi:phosphoenolpyruvate phosphomutase
MNTSSQFRQMLQSNQLEFAMEAHNGLSAKIVEETGFGAIWAGGLSMSASLGVRDNNEASWTQVLDIVEFMSDATSIPILVDADTGYGNFNNVRRLVHKLEQRGVAAMCIEDKVFPKTNSFIDGERQQLADLREFAGKVRAAKDSQTDPDFSVVARVEALIAGFPMGEALRRAHAYADSGADAILIHSKQAGPHQILEFMDRWTLACPVVIVPTMYWSTPTPVFAEAGVSLVIWANHLLRATVTAMQQTAASILATSSVASVEAQIAEVQEIFRLQGAAELQQAEARYLPAPEVAAPVPTSAPAGPVPLGASKGAQPATVR